MRFAYTQENGVVAIVTAASKDAVERVLGLLTDEEYRAHVIEVSIPKGMVFVELPDDWTPPDRDFRNAWKIAGKKTDVHMPAARQIWRERMRAARAPLLAALDVDFQRALEGAGDTKSIVARKQVLRDCTKHPGIDAAKTPEELKAVWPAELST